jgi:hypothetical protein
MTEELHAEEDARAAISARDATSVATIVKMVVDEFREKRVEPVERPDRLVSKMCCVPISTWYCAPREPSPACTHQVAMVHHAVETQGYGQSASVAG